MITARNYCAQAERGLLETANSFKDNREGLSSAGSSLIKKNIADPKAWANKILWRQLHDSAKPHPTALRMAQEVLGFDYVPYAPKSNNDALVDF